MKAVMCRRPPGLPAFSDADLASIAQGALAWNHSLPPGGVRASVEGGWVTLSGEVHWNYQRQDAIDCVRALPSVAGISNRITLYAST